MTKIAWHCATQKDLTDLTKKLTQRDFIMFGGVLPTTLVMDREFKLGKRTMKLHTDMVINNTMGLENILSTSRMDEWVKHKGDPDYDCYTVVEFVAGDNPETSH
ncbi:hypothetical protein [Lapidilactobacillus wuchangensis]|uniref:hypothetical protein n=1 Tax=Lapidilactobacillus wuchangensis TaxID=2486001 RepID=UPI000F7713B7|nr:hypothetical protein [Lapidilactobacillus wuchangensis]